MDLLYVNVFLFYSHVHIGKSDVSVCSTNRLYVHDGNFDL